MRKSLKNKSSIMAMLSIAIIFTATLSSCNQREVFNQYVALPNKGWGTDSLAVFRPNIDDATAAYDISIQIRNDNTYPYSNLWLFIDAISPEGHYARDTVECILAYPNGEWIGSGWGSLYSIQCPYRLNTKFSSAGNYTFRIMQGMRDDDISGIHSIGLKIEESNVND